MDLFSTAEDNINKLPFNLPELDGYRSRWDDNLNGHIIDVPNGKLFYSEHYFNKKLAIDALSIS